MTSAAKKHKRHLAKLALKRERASARTLSSKTTTSLVKAAVKRSRRRTVGDMRQEMLEMGGKLIVFAPHGDATPAQIHAWKTVECKGLLVLENGCCVPHVYYRKGGLQGPSRIRAHNAACAALRDPTWRQRRDGNDGDGDGDGRGDGGGGGGGGGGDAHGWPTDMVLSHLCHMPACCNPAHLVAEARWRNQKRVYCGRTGSCDCGMDPPCAQTYHPASWWTDERHWPRAARRFRATLRRSAASAFSSCHVDKLPSDHYRVEDTKARNRRGRHERGKLHKQQARKNALKIRKASSL